MKALVRLLVVAVGLVALAVAALVAYIALVFDPNDYRERLAAEVTRHTGRALVIDGDIGLSLFPWLGVELAGVRLADAPGFGDQPFARIARAHVRARPWPLVRGEVEVDRVLLDGLELRLVREADGRTNWADLLGKPEAVASEPATPSRGAGAALGGLAALAVGGIEIDAAALSWDDRQRGVVQRLDNLSLSTGEIRPGAAFPLELGADLESSAPAIALRAELAAKVRLAADLARVDIDGLAVRVRGGGADWPGGAGELELDAAMTLDLAADTLTLSRVTLRGWGVQAGGDVTVRRGDDALRYAGAVEVPEFSPRDMLAALGQPLTTADAQALRRASLRARFEGSERAVAIEGLALRVDDSLLSGEAAVTDFARQALRFDLALDALDLDRYLPPRRDAPAAPVTPGAVVAAGADPAGLRALVLDGRLRIGRLTVAGLQLGDVSAEARAADGVLRVAPLAARLYDGRYAGNIGVDARGARLRVTLDEALDGVQIGPLLRDLQRKDARLTGTAQLRARLQASGNDTDALKRSLAGDASFRFADGAIVGVNIAQLLREAGARLKGEPVPAASGANQTDFTELTGTLKIVDGVVRNDDLRASSPLLRVAGSGSADLVREQIDYRLRASVVGTLTGQGGRPLEELRGVTVPIRVSGRFDAPVYALDLDSLVTDAVRERARERIEQQLQEKVPERLQEDLRRGLRGLLR